MLPSLARAHGDVPYTLDVVFADRGEGRQPFIVTTYGMVFRQNGEWVMACEESVSPGPKEWSMAPDGLVVMGHATGVSTSRDFCDYPEATGIPSSVRWMEQAPAVGGGLAWWMLVDVFQPGRNLFASFDGGLAYEHIAIPEHLLVTAMRADQSTPGRVVATAQDPATREHALIETLDSGQTWSDRALDFGVGVPRLMSVGPSGVFVRNARVEGSELFRAENTAAPFVKALDLGDIPGFVSELDDGEVWVAAGAGRAWRSDDGGETWTKREEVGDLMCLREDAGTLYACVVDRVNNVAVKTSVDGGQTWTPLLRYDEIVGMLSCDLNSAGGTCEDYWLLSAIGLGIDIGSSGGGDTEPEPEGWSCASSGVVGFAAALGLLIRRRRLRLRGRAGLPSAR